MSLKHVKTAPTVWRDAVFGFMREHAKSEKITVPMMLQYLCLSYYWLDEKLVFNCKMQESIATSRAIGTVHIGKYEENIAECHWMFEIVESSTIFTWIGLCFDVSKASEDRFPGRQIIFDSFTKQILRHQSLSNIVLFKGKKRGFKLQSGDQIKMVLKVQEKKLQFTVIRGDEVCIFDEQSGWTFDGKMCIVVRCFHSPHKDEISDAVKLSEFSIRQK